jgi:hypothetical protein
MKTCILLILLLLSANSYAQEKLILGFDFGSNIAGQHNTDMPANARYIYSPASLYGIEAGYSFSEALTLRAQFFYDERNIKYERQWDYGTTGTNITFENIEIPITLKYALFGNRSQGYIFTGPVLNFIKDGGTNIGVTTGLGYSYALTHIVTFFGEGGYTFGLKNISNLYSYVSEDYSSKVFSRDFRINAGMLFNIALPIEY